MKIELLTRGDDGHATPGIVVDYDPQSVTYELAKEPAPEGTITAINCKFVWNGEPVRFFVPMNLLREVRETLEDGEEFVSHQPTTEALSLVTERMNQRAGDQSCDQRGPQ
jgi:hypothetical protein